MPPRKQSSEHIAKRVSAMRASGGYRRNGELLAERNKARTGYKHSEKWKSHMRAVMRGKQNSLGTVRSLEYRRHLSDYWTGNPSHNHWVDGRGGARQSERMKEMGRIEYRLWREAVFQRDNYTCIRCGTCGGKLQADHIKPWSKFPELRYAIDNGRTLCKPGHLSRKNWEEVPP